MWKTIDEFSDYEVSTDGTIRNIKTQVTLTRYGSQVRIGGKKRSIARIVAEAFIPNPNNYKFTKLKNANGNDFSVDNIMWSFGVKTPRPIIGTDIKTGKDIYFPTIKFAVKNGFVAATIVKCCYGERESYKGYKWRFGDEI